MKKIKTYSLFISEGSSYIPEQEVKPVRIFDHKDEQLEKVKQAFPGLLVTSVLDTNPVRYDLKKSENSVIDYSIRLFNDGLSLVRYYTGDYGSIHTYRKAKVNNLDGAIKFISKLENETEIDKLEREKLYDEVFNESLNKRLNERLNERVDLIRETERRLKEISDRNDDIGFLAGSILELKEATEQEIFSKTYR